MFSRQLYLDLSDQNDHRDELISNDARNIKNSYFYRLKGFVNDIITKKDVKEINRSIQEKITWIFGSNKPSISLNSHGTKNDYRLNNPRSPIAIAEMLIKQTEHIRDENGNFPKQLKIFVSQCYGGDHLEIIDAMLQAKGIGNYRLVGSPLKISSNNIATIHESTPAYLYAKDKNRKYKYLHELKRGENSRDNNGDLIKSKKEIHHATLNITEEDLSSLPKDDQLKVKKMYEDKVIEYRDIRIKAEELDEIIKQAVKNFDGFRCFIQLPESIQTIDDMYLFFNRLQICMPPNSELSNQSVVIYTNENQSKLLEECDLVYLKHFVSVIQNNTDNTTQSKQDNTDTDSSKYNKFDARKKGRLKSIIFEASKDYNLGKTDEIKIDLSKLTINSEDISYLVSCLDDFRILLKTPPTIYFREDQQAICDQMLEQLKAEGIKINKTVMLDRLTSLKNYHTAQNRDPLCKAQQPSQSVPPHQGRSSLLRLKRR